MYNNSMWNRKTSQIILGKNISFLDKIGKSKKFGSKALEDELYMHFVCHNQLYIKAISYFLPTHDRKTLLCYVVHVCVLKI